jgi:molybdate transport system substrate-binding protein
MKGWLLLVTLLALVTATEAKNQPTLTVAAASDLTFPFKEIGPLFEKAHGVKTTFIFGSTGNLAKQIEHGAPVDVFFAADVGFVDQLKQKGVTIPESQTLYAQGRIVLAWAKKTGLTLAELKDLLHPQIRHIAIAHPGHAPYGKAAREALETVGLWDRLKSKLVYGENLSVVNVPEVNYALIDSALHKPLNQMATVVKRSSRPELGLAFIQFVNGSQGRPILKRFGFLLPGEF